MLVEQGMSVADTLLTSGHIDAAAIDAWHAALLSWPEFARSDSEAVLMVAGESRMLPDGAVVTARDVIWLQAEAPVLRYSATVATEPSAAKPLLVLADQILAQVIEASEERPFLGLRLDLDLDEIARLLLELGDRGAAPVAADRGLFVARMDEALLDAVLRMVKLLDTPEDIAVLAPAVKREIYYRVLRGELGQRLVDLAECDGGNHRIVRAIEWLKQHYAAPLRIEELAEAMHMSSSALHHRFKAVTAMSPLQYQKHLRLHEARRLMFADGIECATAGHRVGYESPSQFSREYRRLFGAPPRIEIARLREAGAEA